MTVKAILSHKGNNVVTIKPTATLCDAAEILDEHGIGAVVITGADQQILGILSERDIVRTIAHKARVAGGYQLFDEPVEKVMTRQVATCKESDTVYELMERMTTGKSPWTTFATFAEVTTPSDKDATNRRGKQV